MIAIIIRYILRSCFVSYDRTEASSLYLPYYVESCDQNRCCRGFAGYANRAPCEMVCTLSGWGYKTPRTALYCTNYVYTLRRLDFRLRAYSVTLHAKPRCMTVNRLSICVIWDISSTVVSRHAQDVRRCRVRRTWSIQYSPVQLSVRSLLRGYDHAVALRRTFSTIN